MQSGTRVDIERILLIGAGQLGMAVFRALARRIKSSKSPLNVLVSPQFLSDPNEIEQNSLRELESSGARLVPFDLATASDTDLNLLFADFNTVINCTGFVVGPGTQLKVTRAVLAAKVPRYFPWQFGVDYDRVGMGSGQPVFDEQYEVRTLLRSQSSTEWVIVSTGMFTSFLFEPAFDVVNLENNTIHALGGWDNQVTVTTPEDVGRLTTEIFLEEPRIANEVVFVAGDTISYGRLADVVEAVSGNKFERIEWTLDELRASLALQPQDVMLRYRVGFATGTGMWWEKSSTYNHQKGIKTADVEDWLRQHLVRYEPAKIFT
ncbi:aromatic alcohol reductase [Pseudomonas fluorescens]|uniref:aromatic alcohol reductase n=1 Tax=Pseudomonas fluorescens TaxID=294 RepID=UPI0019128127|nr:aromatic alcohol reductase [Pseudomonas fluorescens]